MARPSRAIPIALAALLLPVLAPPAAADCLHAPPLVEPCGQVQPPSCTLELGPTVCGVRVPQDDCDVVPDCQFIGGVGFVGTAEGFLSTLSGFAVQVVRLAVPDSGDAVLLMGEGTATTVRAGRTGTCEGGARMVLEASRKPFDLEPTVTIHYGAARSPGDAGLVLPCVMGHTHQPPQRAIQGSFGGAWSAEQARATFHWNISVSAPDAEGTRTVSYQYFGTNGDRDTFVGRLVEVR